MPYGSPIPPKIPVDHRIIADDTCTIPTVHYAREYEAIGWQLVPIQWMEKRPKRKGWQYQKNVLPIPDDWQGNLGLLHAWSKTCSIDIDNLDKARAWLKAEHGVDLDTLLEAADAVQIVSGQPNRAKLIYRLPEPMLKTYATVDGVQVIDFRCISSKGTSFQDVLPPSMHPSGEQYRWAGSGDWRHLPELPEELKRVWTALLDEHKDARGHDDVNGTEHLPTEFDVAEALSFIDPDLPRDDWLKVCMAFKAAGGTWEDFDEWSSRGAKYRGPDDTRKLWESVKAKGGVGVGTLIRSAKEAGWTPPKPSIEQMFGETTATDVVDVVDQVEPARVTIGRIKAQLVLNENGGTRQLMGNVETALRLGAGKLYPRVQFNELTKYNELVMGGKVIRAADDLVNGVRSRMTRDFAVQFSKGDVFDTIDMLARENSYNPLAEWLNSLRWDNQRRLDNWLVRLAHAEDTPYSQRVGRYLIMSLVERALEPGCKQDYTVVFEGVQGQRKTEFVRELAPNPDWHGSITINPKNLSDTALAAQRVWIAEIGELVGLNKVDEESIKQFMTEREDVIRVRYSKYFDKFPRSFCFVGTSNDSDWLNLLSGARRFLPVAVHDLDVAGLIAEREQLFAEAAFDAVFYSAFSHCSDIEALAAPEQAARRQEAPWEADLDEWLDRQAKAGRRAIASAEIFFHVFEDKNPTRSLQRQVAAAMARRSDKWFRPRNGNVVPDGGLYVGRKAKGWQIVDVFAAAVEFPPSGTLQEPFWNE